MIRLFLAIFATFMVSQPAFALCEGQTPCELGDRSYHVRAPDDWDGVTPLPVLLHFHGWARQGTLVVNHGRISGATRRRGVLLLAPNGLRKTWDFWAPGSGDTDFAAAVIEDAATRYPIDRSQIYVSGYSWGSSMAWRYACENGQDVAALLAVSGTIDQEEVCETMPREVRHVHGLADTVLRFPMGPGGDQTYPVALWRDHLGCGAGTSEGPYNIRSFLAFERTVWENCERGSVTLDVHPGAHFIPHGWIGWQLDQIMGRTPKFP